MSDVVLLLASEEEFSAMREEWNRLLASSSTNSIFLTWEWQHAWWQHFRLENQSLNVVHARDRQGELKGILPLYIERDGKPGRGTIRFLGAGEVCSDFLGIIAENRHEAEITTWMFQYAIREWKSCEWELTDIPAGSNFLVLLVALLKENNVSYSVREGEICPFLDLPDSLNEFQKALKPNMRSNYRKSRNKLKKRLGGIYRQTLEQDGLMSIYDSLFDLHRARFGKVGKASVFLSDRMRRFHMSVGEMFRENGWLRFYVARAEDRIIGSLYCFAYAGKMYYYQGGIAPEYDDLSIGLLLLGKAMEDSIETGIQEFELLRGAEEYKWRWTDKYRRTMKVFVYPTGFGGRVNCLFDRVRWGCLDFLKKMLKSDAGKLIEGKELVVIPLGRERADSEG